MILKHWSENKSKKETEIKPVKICYEYEQIDFEPSEPKEPDIPAVRRIINGKLYDTSKAKLVFSGKIPLDLLAFDPSYSSAKKCLKEDTIIYKGKCEWFRVIRGEIRTMSAYDVKEILGRFDVDKYIELFGEPELA